jgi:hypothetical protein
MLKRFGIPALALAGVMALASPAVTLAAGRDDHRGRGGFEQNERFRDRDDHGARFDHRGGFNFGVGIYAPPAPANGYYDQFGVWHPYGFYDQFGVWHAY